MASSAPKGSSTPPAQSRPVHPVAFAAALIVLYPLDVLIIGHLGLESFVLRLAWACVLLAQYWIAPRLSPENHRRYVALTCAVDELFLSGLIALTGGVASPLFTFLFVFPIIHALTYPLHVQGTLASGMMAALGYVLLGHAAGLSLLKVSTWVLLTVGATFFGWRATLQAHQVLEAQAEVRLERERRELLEKLALSSYQRAQSEKLMLLGRLAANVMHELNNPLAYVRASVGFLQEKMLSRPQEDAEELAEAFDEALHGLTRMREISSDLRGFSRLEGSEPVECHVAEVVEDAARIARLRLKHVARLRVELPEDLPLVKVRPRILAQVLVNLMVNAADALEEDSTKEGEIRVRGLRQAEQVMLMVEDNGPGIPPVVLQHLFQPFFTTKGPEKGTGLGLSLSREMVERFGGSLEAENRPEGGACLRLTLTTTVSRSPGGRGMPVPPSEAPSP